MAPSIHKKVKISANQSKSVKSTGHRAPTVKEAAKHTAKPAPAIVSAKGKERASTQAPLLKAYQAKSAARSEAGPSSSAPPATFKVVAGSYEKLLYGLEGSTRAEGSRYSFQLKPIFIFPAHISSVRAVAASPQGGKWLATGSGDEIVKVWDLRRRKEIGGLMHHEGSITHLEFPSRSHLLSASEDGTLCLFHARDWGVLRSLKGHKGRVNSVAVHPSGKLALSVGKDRTLRMWDLMRGKGSASTKLGKEGEVVRWSTDGSQLVVLSQLTIDLYTNDMQLRHIINHPSRLHDVKFCKRVNGEGEVLLVAAEDKKVSIYDLPSDPEKAPSIIAEMVGHSNRVKAIEILAIALPSSNRPSTTIVSTISSDGKIHIYDLADLPATPEQKLQLTPVAEYDTKGCRLTCLALADGEVLSAVDANGKRKRSSDEDAEEGEEDNVGWTAQQLDEAASGDEQEIEGEAEAESDSGSDDE
ncbi:WD40-repeat-containing domain protein [Fomitopsis serialis]|uniref:WD40-repeat-containing domain protein n=1 Tax=Fomitopsis serialis TaxID=139415 RepID=UPI0020081F4A|nr:WD40-repeat-containing domain protein [Neoantrodia serialis]KAH9926918.1 WD40-repeat-containing domain protein [Neoantrodia serialis]